ncbi:MAG: DUF5657 family protein [Microgenomates group bacterium]|nr:hypothetical protein [Candidatus Woesebacteria bacterium]MBP6882994.1 hypothetical protein [Candidatus Woesebacteria bacterium]QQR63756.1 MAG: hypothetical protein IPH70_04615 [Candidatus Roizmanbacteria bacterium]
MQELLNLFSTNRSIFDLLFKLFAIVISILYLIYAFIVLRQSRLMLRAIEETGGTAIRFISIIQVFLAIFLILLSFGII